MVSTGCGRRSPTLAEERLRGQKRCYLTSSNNTGTEDGASRTEGSYCHVTFASKCGFLLSGQINHGDGIHMKTLQTLKKKHGAR